MTPVSRDEIYTVTDLTRSIRFILEEEFPLVWVSGEISNYRLPSSGHAYFVLKDEETQIRCVMFRAQKRFITFEPKDGLEVLLKGRLNVYEPRGEYQLIADHLEPRGAGALRLAFEQLKEKLFREGLFDESRKKPIPEFPRKIGIVTSPTGAAVRDIIKIITRRFPPVHILIYPVRVQGKGAAEEIAEGIRFLNRQKDIDVIITGRGGGSIEDLWAFNEEVTARAIAGSKIPVISAVGHEIDFTISDFAADLRAATPSAAAEIVVRDREELLRQVLTAGQRLGHRIRTIVSGLRDTVAGLSGTRALTDPFARVRDQQQRIDDLHTRVNRGMVLHFRRGKERGGHLAGRIQAQNPKNRIGQSGKILIELEKRLRAIIAGQTCLTQRSLSALSGRLNALSPLAVLERGYGICRKMPEMKPVRDASLISPGDEVSVRLWKGELICEVAGVRTADDR